MTDRRPPRANVQTRPSRRTPARGPQGTKPRPAGRGSSWHYVRDPEPNSRFNVTIYGRRPEPRQSTEVNACGVLLTGFIIAGVVIGAYLLRPRRIELVHTELRDGWTARITRTGRWSDEQGWLGRTRYDLEIVDADNTVYSYRPLIFELEHAIEFMDAELDGLGARRL